MAEERYKCPFCVQHGLLPDRKYKLYVNKDKGVYHCFRCGTSGKVEEIEHLLPQLEKYTGTIAVTGRPALEFREVVVRIPVQSLPESYPKAYLFLKRKNLLWLDTVEIVEAMWGYGLRFPVYFDGKLLGYQTRTFPYGTAPFPKYLTTPGLRKSEILWGYDIVDSNVVVVVEGLFDVLSLPGYSVATFGTYVSRRQAELICQKFSAVVVLYDTDAQQQSLKTATRFHRRGLDAYVGVLKDQKSPGDCTLEELLRVYCYCLGDSSWYRLGELLEEYNEGRTEGDDRFPEKRGRAGLC